MGSPTLGPSIFPAVIPQPINPNTWRFQISGFTVISQDEVILYFSNNLRVGDRVLFSGMKTLTALEGRQATVYPWQTGGPYPRVWELRGNRLRVNYLGIVPAGITGLVDEIGVVNRIG